MLRVGTDSLDALRRRGAERPLSAFPRRAWERDERLAPVEPRDHVCICVASLV